MKVSLILGTNMYEWIHYVFEAFLVDSKLSTEMVRYEEFIHSRQLKG